MIEIMPGTLYKVIKRLKNPCIVRIIMNKGKLNLKPKMDLRWAQ